MRQGHGAPGLRVGILGGSFNPAHDGHVHISLLALKLLHLDEVWWMVSPQNPLKSAADIAPFDERMDGARALARHPDILVTDIEARLGTTYTADTLAKLATCFPRTHFVWLMGADNLAQISKWQRLTRIFHLVTIAVFDRAPYSFDALAGKAAHAFARFKLRHRDARSLAERGPPGWIFFHTRLHPATATAIRSGRAAHRRQRTGGAGAATRRKKPPPPKPVMPPPDKLLELVQRELDDHKAEDIVVIDLIGKSTIGDYMVLATGQSSRQITTMADRLVRLLKSHGLGGLTPEGMRQADWILIDAGDIVIHLFRPEIREFYSLEKMWGAELIDPDQPVGEQV